MLIQADVWIHTSTECSGLCSSCYQLLRMDIGEVYPSYTNTEKERYVYQPSREQRIHDGFDRKKQAVKMADVWGIEKCWASIYESCRQHGDFSSFRSNRKTVSGKVGSILRAQESHKSMVGAA